MSTTHAVGFHGKAFRVSEWVLGIVGLIAAFLGLFIFFGGEEQSIGLGGDASWRVGDIHPAWGYGLLAAGIVGILLAGVLFQHDRHLGVRAERSSESDLLVHAVVFALVNAFIWVQDIVIGDGLNYAFWVTIPWAVGLAAHAYAVLRERRHATG